MAMMKKNTQGKALQAHMAMMKKTDAQALLEWEIACNTNNERGNTYDQSEINALYGRDNGDGNGATKTVHLHSHMGTEFRYICIKRFQYGGYIPNVRFEHKDCTGNQLIDEVNCYKKFVDKAESDYLCPVLKWFTSKSDKVTATSKKMQNNVCIIAQKAVYVSDLENACKKAAEMNGESEWYGRYKEMKKFSSEMGWRDAIYNPGNSGVIYDYSTNKYKAVFIDYAL